jgi:hypothetical protein
MVVLFIVVSCLLHHVTRSSIAYRAKFELFSALRTVYEGKNCLQIQTLDFSRFYLHVAVMFKYDLFDTALLKIGYPCKKIY